MRLRIDRAANLAIRRAMQQRFIDTARQAIETEMSTKVRSMKEADRGLRDAQSLSRIGEGALNTQSQITTRIQELAIQGANAGLSPEARAAISGEMGALQQEFERIGETTSIGNNRLASGGSLQVMADDRGTLIEQSLPSMGTTASSLAGIDSMPPANAISVADSALSSTINARVQLGTYGNIYARANSNLAQSMEAHTQALTRLNALSTDPEANDPLTELRAKLRAKLQANLES